VARKFCLGWSKYYHTFFGDDIDIKPIFPRLISAVPTTSELSQRICENLTGLCRG